MDDSSTKDVLQNIKDHSSKVKKQQADAMEVEQQDSSAVEIRLATTISELQTRLDRRRAELELLKSQISNPISTVPSQTPKERLKQLLTLTQAYSSLTPTPPDLPTPTSALQPLLAARTLSSTCTSTKTSLLTAQDRLSSATQQLSQEERQLADSQQLTEALQARTAKLQRKQRENLTKSEGEKVRELREAKGERVKVFERERERLENVLDRFVDAHLAAMLAAEEIGGPVVGELMDVDEDMLSAGFSAQGKPKSKPVSDAKRQRRIDEIWGAIAGPEEGEAPPENETEAAAVEVKRLLDELVRTGGYVSLERDSAVARFLVRSRVAQFHPKDAGRLRLVDFARELDE